MKRFLIPLFALVFLVSTPVAYAQGAAGLNLSDNGTVTGGGGLSLPGSGAPAANTIENVNTANTVVSQNSGDSSAGAAALANNSNNLTSIKNAAGSATTKTNDPNANKTGNYQGSNNKVDENSYDGIMMKIMSLFAWLLGVAILTLDNVVYYTVVHMGDYIKGLTAIGTVWRILRDIGNMVLIFGFLAIGVTVVLGVDGFGYSKKMLPMLLVAAVFLNFSLFFSEAVIDAGNLFATVFYTQINNGQDAAPSNPITDASGHAGISGAIMNQLGLASIYGAAVNTNSSGGQLNSVFNPGNPWFIGFMGILLFLVAAFVMFSLAFILVARFVYLVFLIVLAPIGFAGIAVPKMEDTAKWWWGALFEQTITAPILLLLLYVALAVITDAHFLTGFAQGTNGSVAGGWTGLFGANPNTAAFGNLMMSFMVAMGLLLLVTSTAKNMSAFGAGVATKWGSRLSGLGLVAAGAGFAGRSTIGSLGNRVSKSIKGSALGRSAIGRGIAGTIDNRVAKATFDVRNTGLAKAAGGAGLDLGKGQKGGYVADEKARIKALEGAAESIKDRAKTSIESQVVDDANNTKEKRRIEREAAEAEVSKATQDRFAKNAELGRINAQRDRDPNWMNNPNNVQKLSDAEKALTESQNALTAATNKAVEAKNLETLATKNAKEIQTTIEAPIKAETNERKREYVGRLESIWKYSTGSADAAANIRKNIGKSKEDQENKKILDAIKKAAKASEKEEGGEKEEKEEKKDSDH